MTVGGGGNDNVCNAFCPSDSIATASDLPTCNFTCTVRAGECDNTIRRERKCLILPDLERYAGARPANADWLSRISDRFGMLPDIPDSLCRNISVEEEYWVEQSAQSFTFGSSLDSIRTAVTYTVCGPVCTPPSENEFVKKACEAGLDSGADTKSQACATPTLGVNFTSRVCIQGSVDSHGFDTRFDSCTFPEHGEFVEHVCVSGWYDSVGRDTDLETCSVPNDETYPNLTDAQRLDRTGCRDPEAFNYDSTALLDGECVLFGCTNIHSPNYNYRATRSDSTQC
jgi:hypothetical protein